MAVYSKIASIADAPASYERLKKMYGIFVFTLTVARFCMKNDIKINENAVMCTS